MGSASLNLTHSEAVREFTRSKDGTRISFIRLGDGPSIVFVHGSLSSGTDWLGVANALSRRFTCFLMDRRGHGRSDWGASTYSMDRESEDVAAVLSAAGSGASLVAHSFGAVCALEAATRTPVHRLALYEAPLPIDGLIAGENLITYARALAEGRLDDALQIGLEKFVRLTTAQVNAMRSSRSWPRLIAMVPGWPRELEVMDKVNPDIKAYAAITCPTLLFLGSESPEHPFRKATAALTRTLPDVRVTTLAGQSHMAMRSARDLLAYHITEFLQDR